MSARAAITGSAWAAPAAVRQQDLWDGFFARHYGHNAYAERVWRGTGVRARHGAVDPRHEDPSRWGTGARMARYLQEAMPLGKEAVGLALERAGLDAADVGLFAVVSCTGYVTPGLDVLLARDLGMAADTQRLLVGHMGCYAALPGLGTVSDFVVARRRPAVMLCLELTTLHLQPPSPESVPRGRPSEQEMQQVVAHALFSDAAAAVVVEPGQVRSGLEVLDVAALTDTATADHMTWDVTDLGFRMGLSPRVPDVLALHVRDVVAGLLSRNGLRPEDVHGYAVHPGGPRILEVVADRLGLPGDALAPSYDVLAEHGNCSSATVLLVLERLLATRPVGPEGGHIVMMAFGPGLTLYAALLRVAPAH